MDRIADKNFNRIWQGFWQLADPKIWIASLIPMLVGAATAFNLKGVFNLYWFIWTMIGIFSIEIGKNAINELIDYQSGVDKFVQEENRTPFSGGKKTIIDEKLDLIEVKVIAVITMLIGAIIGIYIAINTEPKILWVGIPGFLFSIFYSLPPLQLSYRGLGEITVGITFGPLILIGTYIVQAHSFSLLVLLISLPIGFLISNILWINQYPDYEADKKGNKKNWVVRLGRKRGIRIYISLFVATYICLALLLVIFNSIIWLLPFISLPLVFQAVKIAKKYYNDIPKLIAANAKTVQIYQLVGITMGIAAILDRIF